MATFTKSASPPAQAMRLNLLEQKVRNLDPATAPDLTALTAGVNKLAELTLRGSQDADS